MDMIEEIKKCKSRYDEIKSKCNRMGREPNYEEQKLMVDLTNRAAELDVELNRATGSLTMPNDGSIGDYTMRAKKSGPFESLGSQLKAIREAATPGAKTDDRLFEIRAAQGLSETVPSDGGFLLQSDFTSELMHDAFETGLLAKRCRRLPITRGNSIEMPGIDETSRATGSRWGGVRGYWKDEASTLTKSKPKFRKIKLECHKMIGLCYLTDELMDDVAAMESYVRQAFTDEFGFMMDQAIIAGSGAGQPLGILNSGGTVSIAGSGGSGTITYVDVIGMWSRLIGSARAGSVWLYNQSCEPQLYQMSLSVGSGGSAVYLPAGGASASPYGTLFGRPCLPCEQCAPLSTTGDIILGNFKRGYLLGEKSGGIQTDLSIHVEFLTDQSVFRATYRWDGSPLLSSPITPYGGGNTVGNFVKLDTRS